MTSKENSTLDNSFAEEIDNDEIINWEEEATAIINDVKTHLADIHISRKLKSSDSHIYLNVRTFEGAAYCVHVSSMGFRIVSQIFDSIDDNLQEPPPEEEIYETPYALLDKISPRYVESFGNQLCKQLLHLQHMRAELREEDEEGIEEEDEEHSGSNP